MNSHFKASYTLKSKLQHATFLRILYNVNASCHLMLAVLHCYVVADCHELWGEGMRREMLGKSKVETVPP